MNWFGDSWDAPVNAPAAKVETPAGIERGHSGERVAIGETPHLYVNRGAVPVVGFHGSRPPDLRSTGWALRGQLT